MGQIWLYVGKLHRFAGTKLYISLIGMTLVSMLEGVGLLLLVPMLSLIGLFSASVVSVPYLTRIIQPITDLSPSIQMPVILSAYVVLIAGQGFMQRRLAVLNERIEQGFIRHLRIEVYQGLLLSNWSYFLNKRKSDFIHITTSELSRVNYTVYLALRLATSLVFTIVQIGIALLLSVKLTICIIVCGLVFIFFSRIFVQRARQLGGEATDLTKSLYAGMTDHLSGIKDIKSNMMEASHIRWFRSLSQQIEDNNVRFAALQQTSQYVYKLVSGVLLAAFLYGSYAILKVDAATLVLVVIIFSRLWPRFASLQSGGEQIAQSIPALQIVSELLQECEAAKELTLEQLHHNANTTRITQGIECRGLYHRYGETHTYALENINLHIPANSMTAIVGKSGAGKSTLIDTLIGMVKPENGEVLIDGRPIISAEDEQGGGSDLAFRQSVSYVSQEPFLFHASLRENLLVAAPGATEDQIWEALRFAASEDFVRRLPQGLDTELGDRGVRLSGGERQRIVLARAILRKPSLLILDEATSSLDSENEAHIQAALEQLKGSMTIIVIAHRLSTIRYADQVLVMEQGRLIRQGGYQQLAAEPDGVFGKLLNYQLAGYAGASSSR